MSDTINRKVIFIASFLTLIAAGVGFAVRTAVIGEWGTEFGFTKFDLGTITGGGLVGFGVVIILGSMFVDQIGYKTILLLALVMHVLSAIITLAATPIYAAFGQDATYWCLYIGLFMFAIANGLCEAVINPLVATLYPTKKTHYLNILHAGWPGGLILGGLVAFLLVGDNAVLMKLRWEIPIALFLVPTAIYGFLVIKEKFPHSETKAAGVSYGEMLKQFASPILLFLFVLHAMVGYVELGTDSWITNIMNNVIGQSILLFIYTSSLMFVLRFFAGPIVERINPIGLLLLSAILGAIGLFWLGSAESAVLIVAAATVYGIGKTFLWPTMLGVVGERFPRGGALTMGTMGGIGMLSAGLLGGPGIGYTYDYYASEKLETVSAPTLSRYTSEKKNSFLFFPAVAGLDGSKVSVLENDGAQLAADMQRVKDSGEDLSEHAPLVNLAKWWEDAEKFEVEDAGPVKTANIYGGRSALKVTSLVPLTMALGYLLLLLYFASQGGYKQEEIDGEKYTGGVEGPAEM